MNTRRDIYFKNSKFIIITSVSDPFHFDMDPDPRIRFVK